MHRDMFEVNFFQAPVQILASHLHLMSIFQNFLFVYERDTLCMMMMILKLLIFSPYLLFLNYPTSRIEHENLG